MPSFRITTPLHKLALATTTGDGPTICLADSIELREEGGRDRTYLRRNAFWILEPLDPAGSDSAVRIRNLKTEGLLCQSGGRAVDQPPGFPPSDETHWDLFRVPGGSNREFFVRNRASGKFLQPGWQLDYKVYVQSHAESPGVGTKGYIWQFDPEPDGTYFFTARSDGNGEQWMPRLKPDDDQQIVWFVKTYPKMSTPQLSTDIMSALSDAAGVWNEAFRKLGLGIRLARSQAQTSGQLTIDYADLGFPGPGAAQTLSTGKGYVGAELADTSTMTFNSTATFKYSWDSNRVESWFGVESFHGAATHEFGHVLGLGHFAEQSSVMYETFAVGSGKLVFQDGKPHLNAHDLLRLKLRYRVSADPEDFAGRAARRFPDFTTPF